MTSIEDLKAEIVQARVVYQYDKKNGQEYFKPFLLTDAGISYLGVTIPVDFRELNKFGNINTVYGVFSLKAETPSIDAMVGYAVIPGRGVSRIEDRNRVRWMMGIEPNVDVQNPGAIAILELSYPYTVEELKASYRRLARQHHPDMGGDAETFRRVQAAYELLKEAV